MAATMITVGGTHESMPTPRPWMTTVAAPVLPRSVIDRTGAKSNEVKYSVTLPIIMPATRPMMTQPNDFISSSHAQMPAAAPTKRKPARYMPFSRAHMRPAMLVFLPLLPVSLVDTAKQPIIEQTIPEADRKNGRRILSDDLSCAPRVAAAMIDPTYDSKRSAPMPATSPTLSPTLSAITAGLCGSSSSIPASSLPTRSAPTSAALV
mmetsp:Transcript_22744/g.40576  ORF Transcript_22744/g.40576 Transcript_22744/m.40576 type:complete len:207 (-) Transcript_22744:680-1300(-)